MNRVLRMTLVAALGMLTINSMAQVERPGETTVLDAKWTEVQKPSATSDGDLHLAGSSVINFTIKDITKANYSYSYIATLEVRSANKTVKGTKYYQVNRDKNGNITWKVSDTKSGSNWNPTYNWKDVTDVTDNSVEGSITVSDGATGDYLYMAISTTSRTGEVILTSLSSTTNRYDIYDHVGLFGEDTGTAEADIKSNRMKDHNAPIDVYVHRTIAGDGAWSTLCLPFDLTDFKVKKAFGDDIVYAEFDHVDLTKKEIHFKSTKDGMKAGQPYLIKNSKATIDNFFADDVTFTKTGIESINKNGRKSTKESEGYYYVGLLEPTQVNNGGDATYNSNNRSVYIANPDNDGVQKLKKLSPNGTIKAFRAYLYFPVSNNEFETGAKESSLFLSLDDILDGGITGVDKITVDGKPVNNNIYNLNGQMVGTDASVLLQGIYVRNGKKFVVK
ncbi:MAG: hypothetical protein ACI3YX_02805 [Prevotella sp.]